MRETLQKFGGKLAGMVIPNIGAFIAWGLITALVIPTGWLAELGWIDADTTADTLTGNLVGPMIKYLLPVLIAYTGGKMVHGHRGGVLGAIAVFASPQRGNVVTLDTRELALIVDGKLDHVSADELADWIIQGRADYRLIDVRDHKFDRTAALDPQSVKSVTQADAELPAVCAVYTGIVPVVYKASRTLLNNQ